jgi:DNA-binding protein YbaB
MAVQHVQHMQKALTQMNVHIHHVISDITGLTGLAIVDAILSGERDVAKLAIYPAVATGSIRLIPPATPRPARFIDTGASR